MEELNSIISANLYKIRNERNLSLDEVSSITGVSKSMLGQIERGKSNPTISTLWKISTGLKVPFSSFMEKNKAKYEIVNYINIKPISEENGNMKIYTIFPFDINNKFEILNIELEEGCVHKSSNHIDGVEEYVIVNDGDLEIKLGCDYIILNKGKAVRFFANINHMYTNIGKGKCKFQNIIVYTR